MNDDDSLLLGLVFLFLCLLIGFTLGLALGRYGL